MKNIVGLAILISAALAQASSLSQTSYKIFAAPTLGYTELDKPNGEDGREGQPGVGIEGFLIKEKLGLGLIFNRYATPIRGSEDVNVYSENNWLSTEGRLRLWNENFSPYFSAGAGALFQTVNTRVLSSKESIRGQYFIQDIGLGILGALSESFALDLSAKYFQYSNVNGMSYTLSIGVLFPVSKTLTKVSSK